MEVDRLGPMEYVPTRPKRSRCEPHRAFDGLNPNQKSLELDGVIRLMREYEDSPEGGINCSICGKLYKSRVCFAKHLWEHSIYWDLFDGVKNHDRVLSIQAAVILYSGYHMLQDDTNADHNLNFLLVTAPHGSQDKKAEMKDINSNDIPLSQNNVNNNNINHVNRNIIKHRSSPGKRNGSPLKRKKSFELDE